jgi:hypothetical protein
MGTRFVEKGEAANLQFLHGARRPAETGPPSVVITTAKPDICCRLKITEKKHLRN